MDCSTPKHSGSIFTLDHYGLAKLESSEWTGRISPHQATSNKLPCGIININDQRIKLHRFLTDFQWPMVDHINQDPRDNRISNLRPTNHSENGRNRPVSEKTGTCYDKRRGKWLAYIDCNGRTYLGRYNTEEEAINKVKEYNEKHATGRS